MFFVIIFIFLMILVKVFIFFGVVFFGFCGNCEGCLMYLIWVWIDLIDLCVFVGLSWFDLIWLGFVFLKVGLFYGKLVCERLKLVICGIILCNVCFLINVVCYCSFLNDNGVICWMVMKVFNFCWMRIKNFFFLGKIN